jgi:hypothetical protein
MTVSHIRNLKIYTPVAKEPVMLAELLVRRWMEKE